MNVSPELLKTIAYGHASFMFGISLVILFYYFKRIRRVGLIQGHILSVIIAHMLLTGCTLISIEREIYPAGDPWYYVAGIAYFLTDVSLLALWKNQLNQQRKEKSN